MKITFVSNYINHHQAPLCSALFRALGEDFTFIETEPMTQERMAAGWVQDADMFTYCRFWTKERAVCEELFLKSDVVLLGWSRLPAKLIEKRLSSGKVTLRVTERIYKEGQWKAISPRGLKAKYKEHIRYRRKPVYLLCAGAYVASDFALIHAYPGKKFRWGYFPEFRKRTRTQWDLAGEGEARLIFAGRMTELKHPEYALKLARRLKEMSLPFTLEMVGDGPLRKPLEAWTRQQGLSDRVLFRKAVTPQETRGFMEESHIFLFPSNHLEGWGAVVNEAMNSALAVVACESAGSVPFLIENGKNGLTYPEGKYDAFEKQTLRLIRDRNLARTLGLRAYQTIETEWNAEEAAKRLLTLCASLVHEGKAVFFPGRGPLSEAPVIRPKAAWGRRKEPNRQDHA